VNNEETNKVLDNAVELLQSIAEANPGTGEEVGDIVSSVRELQTKVNADTGDDGLKDFYVILKKYPKGTLKDDAKVVRVRAKDIEAAEVQFERVNELDPGMADLVVLTDEQYKSLPVPEKAEATK